MSIEKYFENMQTLHVNTMPNRSYYIPYSAMEDAQKGDRRGSDRFTLLNGEWDFAYHESIHTLPEELIFANDDSAFKKIPVPSVWQCHGYEKQQYTNVRYPIPYDPPYVPYDNPCGVYKRTFNYQKQKQSDRQFINFEGVDSCFYLWMNGSFIGFSQVSHSTSEFDITNALIDGENSICVVVVKWCLGTYFEDQDKFRSSGIFRDVYILGRSENHIRDFFVKTQLSKDYSKAEVQGSIEFYKENTPVSYSLTDTNGSEIAIGTIENGSVSIPVENPVLWNAETPTLYTLALTCGDEIIVTKVGFREIKIIDSVVYINGVKMIFRGVNRHDSSPLVGPAVYIDHMKRDLALMKQHNINAIRTSHYPNSPIFLEMCDEYGFYVIAEADIETHGVDTLAGKEADYCKLADDPTYGHVILDRVQRSVQRDKNHPCVVIWSMGNESGFGINFENALAWTQSFDNTRLTHYESFRARHEDTPDSKALDLYSTMYPSMQEMLKYLNDPKMTRPYILCEFVHAMGNGPGDIEDYFQMFEQHKQTCGGFVWEWCDHAIHMGKTVEGKDIYYYGGDSGEYPHDGNFCMDGLVYPDRRPHTGLLEYKNVLRPVRVVAFDLAKGSFTFKNIQDFTNTKDYLAISYEIMQNGKIIVQGNICESDLDIAPHALKEIIISDAANLNGEYAIRFILTQKVDKAFTKAGHSLGFDQVGTDHFSYKKPEETGEIAFTESAKFINVKGKNFRYIYNKFTGAFEEMVYGNTSVIQKPMEYTVWHAPYDNEPDTRDKWAEYRYNEAKSRSYSTVVTAGADKLTIKTELAITAFIIQPLAHVHVTWEIGANGVITSAIDCKINPNVPRLPRFGVKMFLSNNTDKVTYFGYGPNESYIDKHCSSYLGMFTQAVSELHEDYIKPQENGSRWGCECLCAQNNFGGVKVYSQDSFCFNASYYTQEELAKKKHNYELSKSGYTVLCIDAQQTGVGSHSCGPELQEKYRLTNEISFTFHITPYSK